MRGTGIVSGPIATSANQRGAMPSETKPEDSAEQIVRWFQDRDTWVGVFENHDLGHPKVGAKVAAPFSKSQLDVAIIGRTHMPDTPTIIGWRYILIAKCLTAEDAIKTLWS